MSGTLGCFLKALTRPSTRPMMAAGIMSSGKNQPTAPPASRMTKSSTVFEIVFS